MPNPQHCQTERRWLTMQDAAIYSGLNIRTLRNYINDRLIVSSTVRAPGASRGRRLICRQSLDRFIEAGIGKSSEIKIATHG